jgi:glutaredoxin
VYVALLAVAVLAWKHLGAGGGGPASSDLSEEQIRALAATVEREEVVMYTTSECPYCRQAEGWLHHYDFAFTECNMSLEAHCEDEFRSYGAEGTPFLVIRRKGQVHYMKDGFDSDEFLNAVRS